MSDDTQAIERANDGIAVPGEARPDVATQPQTETQSVDVEGKARSQGWVPQDEWRGDPEKWRPADEFVRRGEELLPVALERSRAAERKAQELEARLAARERENEEKLSRIERLSISAVQRQREQLEADYRNAQRDAVNSGDVQRFDQLERDKAAAIQDFDKQFQETRAPAQPQGHGLPPQQKAVVDAWRAQNAWFDADPELNAVAQAYHIRLNRDKPGISLQENLAETAKYVRQRYADKFGTTERQIIAPMVESGGGRMAASAGPRGKGANDLPADVRSVGERYVKQGLFKDLNEYAREYWAQD